VDEVRAVISRETPPTWFLLPTINEILNIFVLLRACMDDHAFYGWECVRQYVPGIGWQVDARIKSLRLRRVYADSDMSIGILEILPEMDIALS